MRNEIVSEFVKEVLGPRNGPHEKMESNPLQEYITAVISPFSEIDERDPDEEAEIIGSVSGTEPFLEDNESEEDLSFLAQTSVINPKTKPRSFGLSFNISSVEGEASIDICISWSRYFKNKEDLWERKPRFFFKRDVSIMNTGTEVFYIDSFGETVKKNETPEISLYLIKKRIRENFFHVSVYVVNELVIKKDIPKGEYFKEKTEKHIFQPQIRINCKKGRLEKLKRETLSDVEENELDFIYRNRKVLARGHMCSAIWKDIDPESDYRADRPDGPPFEWVDGTVLDENIRNEFSPPDIRTEFVPVFSVESPSYKWNEKFGAEPELNAEKLSELWFPDEIKKSLYPLVEGYEKWIEFIENQKNLFNDEQKIIINKILKRCRTVLERIKSGLDLIITDENARLSFCFANRVMDIQSRWKRGSGLKWRPFQLAFFLMTIKSIVSPRSEDREICDLLFVPTGAGKTEAYLAIAAFTLAFRRLVYTNGYGVGVIMRYTLRLLTIQQFRRALRMITACEYLRVFGLGSESPVGWRPKLCDIKKDFLWGFERFSIGMWVGGKVAPNRLLETSTTKGKIIPGSINILKGAKDESEPAQIIKCPRCNEILSVPGRGLSGQLHKLNIIARLASGKTTKIKKIIQRISCDVNENCKIVSVEIHQKNNDYFTVTITLKVKKVLLPSDVDNSWEKINGILNENNIDLRIAPARASRPGYFIMYYRSPKGTDVPYNYQIFCPNPQCELNKILWTEAVPSALNNHDTISINGKKIKTNGNLVFSDVMIPEFTRKSECISAGMPIPALTTDEQIYNFPPSFLISTVDKFARIPFEPRVSSIFGNINKYHPRFGYYRRGCPPLSFSPKGGDHPRYPKLAVDVEPFRPPDLIIQDELHLIEGPLGSMVGIYETAVDYLCSQEDMVKYIASTATVKGASSQISSIFVRKLLQFPPNGIDIDDKFFIIQSRSHPLKDDKPGRIYVGVFSPSFGPLTPVVRIWSKLLQEVYERSLKYGKLLDPFWTIVGYFNSIRELAGATSLYRQDIPARLDGISSSPRDLPDDRKIELSGRSKSTDLPLILSALEKEFSGDPSRPVAPDSLFTTSMFGTGVDIPRLSLMIVHGQPKTTSSYIQSTGRVGRSKAGIVITFYKSSRPRDMSYYEMFCGYHMNMEKFVEPVTVSPFSRGALCRCTGPVSVGILRCMMKPKPTIEWHRDESAHEISEKRNIREFVILPEIFEERSQKLPEMRKPEMGFVKKFVSSELEKWRLIVLKKENEKMKYYEYHFPRNPVVLGDSLHEYKGYTVVFHNCPQSLRDIEDTCGFET